MKKLLIHLFIFLSFNQLLPCGLVGYIGNKNCRDFVLKGLSRLEYRGYDSAGIAFLNSSGDIDALKASGELKNLITLVESNPIDGQIGVGHTRWSTHGPAVEKNAHPQFNCDGSIAVVHNGIIENFSSLKSYLSDLEHVFTSDTDTEVIAHLFEELYERYEDIFEVVKTLVNTLDGAYALSIIGKAFPNHLIAIRKGSPLCLGIGKEEMFVASDVLAFMDKAQSCVYLPESSFAIVTAHDIKLFDFDGNTLGIVPQKIDMQHFDVEKKGYKHYMLKEIYEQKNGIHATLNEARSLKAAFLDQLGLTRQKLEGMKSISIVGCGTSWHAARIAEFFFEEVTGLPTSIKLASEFRYMPFFPNEHTLYIFISQSGETADTLEALRMVKRHGLHSVALSNVASSSIIREADGYFLTKAGTEISVASTKAFTTQLAALYWLAHRFALERDKVGEDELEKAESDLLVVAETLENCIEANKQEIIATIAPLYAQYKHFIFLGRHISYPFAMEAALKLKEISYIFAQCYPAGELKHGPIALIDKETPVVIFSSLDELIYKKLVSNAQEVKSRDGHLVVFAFEGQDELLKLAHTKFVFPRVDPLLSSLAMTGVMQFFVYQIAKELKCPIDKPRNLAKAVTVE